MVDLSHWDWAEEFTLPEAAALIDGQQPSENPMLPYRIEPILKRLVDAAVPSILAQQRRTEIPKTALALVGTDRPPTKRGIADLIDFALTDNPRVSRAEIARWLAVVGLRSVYRFDLSPIETQASNVGMEISEVEAIDPSDLPPELDAANMAFRAITNGYGDQSATARNRLIDYLEKNYPEFKPEQVRRIATVANPDKSTGRKKSSKA